MAEIISDQGKEIFASFGKELTEGQKGSVDLLRKNSEKLLSRKINPPENMDKFFENDYWDKVSEEDLD